MREAEANREAEIGRPERGNTGLTAYREISEQLLGAATMEEVAAIALDRVAALLGADGGALLLQGNRPVGGSCPRTYGAPEEIWRRLPESAAQSIIALSQRAGEPVAAADAAAFFAAEGLSAGPVIRNLLLLPLSVGERHLGALVLHDFSGPEDLSRSVEKAAALSLPVAHAIAKVRLLEETSRERRLHQTVLENVFSGVAYLDRELNVVECNTRYARAFGRTPEHVIGRNLLDLVQGSETHDQIIQVSRTGEPLRLSEVSFECPDQPERGTTYWDASLVSVRAPDGSIEGFVSSVVEVTDYVRARRQIEAAQRGREKEARLLAAILENIQNEVAYLDRDFRFVLANPAYVNSCGHSLEELVGRNHFELFPNEENEAIFRHARETGEPVRFVEKPFEYADQPERGVTYWDWSLCPLKNDRGEVEGFVFSLTDMTEQVRTRQDIAEAEAARAREARLLETIQESTPNLLAYLDRDLGFVRVNTAYASMRGLPAEQIVGRRFGEVFPGEARYEDDLRGALDTGRPIQMREFVPAPYQESEEGRHYFDITVVPVTGAEQAEGLVISIVDVTETVRQRERLLEAERARRQLAETLTTEVSHRMKNDLAMVAGLLEAHLRDKDLAPPGTRAIATAIARIRSIAAVHDQLYQTQSESVDLLEALRRIAQISGEALRVANVDVTVDGESVSYPRRPATALCVAGGELITNALKHGAPGGDGRLRIAVEVRPAGGELHLAVWSSGNPVSREFDPGKHGRMGLRLITELVAGQYGGAFLLRPRDDGTQAELIVEEARLRAAG